MLRWTRYFTALAGLVLVASCAADQNPFVAVDSQTTAQLPDDICEDILASFSVEPPFRQTSSERRRLLRVIKEAQENKYGETCGSIPGWRTRFERAYSVAYEDSDRAYYSDEQWDEVSTLREARRDPNYKADAKCYSLIAEYSDALSQFLDESMRASTARETIQKLRLEISKLNCRHDSKWVSEYESLTADAQLMGLLPGPSTRRVPGRNF